MDSNRSKGSAAAPGGDPSAAAPTPAMASDSSRARIDQFFASRKKKKASLPKDEKRDGDPKPGKPFDCSPSSKGSLSGFLVRSPSSVPPKRNLSREVNLVPETSCKRALLSCSERLASSEASLADVGDDLPGKEPLDAGTSGGNPELKKFATDFLSLYCSELPTAEETNRLKRKGSPTFVEEWVETSAKKQERLESRTKKQCSESQAEGRSFGCDGPQGMELEKNHLPKQMGSPHSVDLHDRSDESVGENQHGEISGCLLKRCSKTTCTPGFSRTPKSANRASLFSPGDEFWDAAIQMADGLCAPTDNFLMVPNGQLGLPSDNKASIPVGDGVLCLSSMTKCNIESQTVALKSKYSHELSPLPVKHIDFSCERSDCGKDELCKQRNAAEGSSLIFDKQIITSVIQQDGSCAGRQTSNDEFTSKDVLRDPKAEDQSSTRKPPKGKIKASDLDDGGGGLLIPKCATSSVDVNEKPSTLSVTVCGISSMEEVHHAPLTSYRSRDQTSTPSSSLPLKDSLKLSSWLPPEICSIYMKKGISNLYPWQVDCLQVDGVLDKRNLIYCASTSSGKSMVAEILMLKRLISTGKMALLVLPYVSLCSEKAEHLELLLEPLGKHVRSFYGNQGGGSLPKDTCVAVCTIEKANSLVNRLLEEARLSEVGIIVIDELHMVGDPHRGYLLELLLTKLRYAAGEGNSESASGESSGSSSNKSDSSHGLQIIGMSATMPNVVAVADWLHAGLYQTDFRPVPLEEFIKVGDTIFNKNLEAVRKMTLKTSISGKDPDHIVELCNEIVQEGHSVLLFCSSRKGCESTARHVSKFLKKSSLTSREASEFSDAFSAIDALRKCPAGLDPILEETLPSGVAYHHAGLTVEEREIIETCYRRGIVQVLTATSTLAAGVNLPARRVIFRQPRVGLDFIDGTKYRQMSGRAGRTGIDTRGESILICKPDEVKRVSSIINDTCPPLQSCLSEDKNGMTHAILEVVAGGIVQTASDINRYVRCTLLNSTKPFQDVVKSAQDSIRWLCHKKFLEWNEDTKLYNTTPLGRAAFGSSLNPEESLVVLDDLMRAREGFVLASDMHLVYLVTPTNVDVEPDWDLYYARYMELSAVDQSVASRVGVSEPFLMRMAHGAPMLGHDKSRGKKGLHRSSVGNSSILGSNEQSLRVSKRFYVALMLSRLVQEVPVADVCEAFKVARGLVQALQENAGRFASMVSVFCERLGWHDMEGLVAKFQNRVCFGVRAEIVELTNIPYVKGSRARALYKAGLRTPLAIAGASVSEIVKALFEFSSLAGNESSSVRPMHMGIAKKIRNGARKVVLDQAEEARVAAFSAFKSLGFDVPQISRPLVSKNLEDLDGESKKSTTCGDAIPSPDPHLAAQSCSNGVSHDMERDIHKIENNMVTGVSLDVTSTRGNGTTNIISDRGPVHASKVIGGLDSFLDQWSAVKEFYFDVHFVKRSEPDDAVPFELFGLAVCWEKSPVYYISFPKDLLAYGLINTHNDTTRTKENGAESAPSGANIFEIFNYRWARIAKIMVQKGVRKITWNLKLQIQVLKLPRVSVPKLGRVILEPEKLTGMEIARGSYIVLPSIFVCDGIDICLVSWTLWPDEESKCTPSLEKVIKKRVSNDAAAAAVRDGRWKNQMHKAAHNGCCRRAAQIRALDSVLWKLLVSEDLVEAVTEIENPLTKVLADMELAGVGINMEACLQARHILLIKLKGLEKEAYGLAGMNFSLHTAADVANVLYKHLKLPIPEASKRKQHPSTDKHTLDLLRGQHPIISVIREHRTLSKLMNNTLGSICSRARLCVESQKYIIRGHWLQVSTTTGRLAMEEPNLQCVEHMVAFTSHDSYQGNKSSSDQEKHQINPRDFVIPTQENWLLLTADYSQIELRLMAHFSKDPALIELLSKPDGDVFTMMASQWLGKHESVIISEEREQTKRLVYGILYGMGANTLAEKLECSSEEAVEKIGAFKSSFPGVSLWLREAVESCRQRGYIQTLKGRKRFLSKIKFGSDKEMAKAQRQAVNSICQGSAADIIKIAMINIHSVIAEGCEPLNVNVEEKTNFSLLKGRCQIILQVHDELVLEVDPILVNEAGMFLRSRMEEAVSLLVPLQVKLKVGRTWGSLQPFVSPTS